jgi:uncharacterized C2H2 Zn-finger protein
VYLQDQDSKVKKHIIKMSEGKKYKCHNCEEAFESSEDLSRHLIKDYSLIYVKGKWRKRPLGVDGGSKVSETATSGSVRGTMENCKEDIA